MKNVYPERGGGRFKLSHDLPYQFSCKRDPFVHTHIIRFLILPVVPLASRGSVSEGWGREITLYLEI